MTTDYVYSNLNTPVTQELFEIRPECSLENNVTSLPMDTTKNKSDFMTLKQKIILTE